MMIEGRRGRGRWVVVALGVVLSALVLAVCGGGADGVVDVTPEPQKDTSADDRVEDGSAPALTPPSNEGAGMESEDGVATGWVRLSPPGDFQGVVVSGDGQTIVALEAGRGLISRDGGVSWAAVDWPGEVRSRVALDARGEIVLVAGIGLAAGFEETGVISGDGGASWTDSGEVVQAVGYVAGEEFLVATAERGVVRSQDGGATGETVIANADLDVGGLAPIGVFVNPMDTGEIYVAAASEGGTVRVFRTMDGGATVSVVAEEAALWGWTVVRFSAIGPMIFSQGAGVLFSFDGGESWFTQNQGLESLAVGDLFTSLLDLAVIPESGIPVVATPGELLRFLPSGWETVGGPGGTIRGLAVQVGEDDSGERSRLLVATDDGVWALPGGAVSAPPG